ncbi:efflux RND transporter periplasmic adaptor subunit [Paenibacillus allorhizosphaerae]|uniref:Efflux RND transporter periplasmic adaptor subunit n=1 Tax=Paenibacillus allorhizosphaerae TaxID=2849866 RepID=A0ABM8VE68_9BACL|nr:efflux RND transporter periplasmic adaptor subunit [Paenibacillus allorhizosphaerae]CAG7630336.1 hypothetical protein PAECIP111802_01626 [Paenibacillus allorhizosphaerae]
MNQIFRKAKAAVYAAFMVFMLAGCSATPVTEPLSAGAADTQPKSVKVSKIEKKRIGTPLEQVADVVASVTLDIVTKTPGDVAEILKKRGEPVEQGEVVFRLDPTDMLISREKAEIALQSGQQQLAKAREEWADGKQELHNNIAKAEDNLGNLQKNYGKIRNDYDTGLASKFQVEQLETQVNNAKLDLENMKAKLSTMEKTNPLAAIEQSVQSSAVAIREYDRNLQHMEVKAQVSGVLTDLPIEVGMTLPAAFRAGQSQQLDPIKIKAELTEEAARMVRGKPELSFYVPGQAEKMIAQVRYLADVMSVQSKSYALELEVPNGDRKLKPGMKAQVLLTEEADQLVVSVPTLAVVREGGDAFVFVLNGNIAEKRKVELGRLSDANQEVLSGVKEGEPLIVSGQHQLKDQEKVQPLS